MSDDGVPGTYGGSDLPVKKVDKRYCTGCGTLLALGAACYVPWCSTKSRQSRGNVRGWRMLKRRRTKYRRRFHTEYWLSRVRMGRRPDRSALERWLAAIGLLVVAIVLLRACS